MPPARITLVLPVAAITPGAGVGSPDASGDARVGDRATVAAAMAVVRAGEVQPRAFQSGATGWVSKVVGP